MGLFTSVETQSERLPERQFVLPPDRFCYLVTAWAPTFCRRGGGGGSGGRRGSGGDGGGWGGGREGKGERIISVMDIIHSQAV